MGKRKLAARRACEHGCWQAKEPQKPKAEAHESMWQWSTLYLASLCRPRGVTWTCRGGKVQDSSKPFFFYDLHFWFCIAWSLTPLWTDIDCCLFKFPHYIQACTAGLTNNELEDNANFLAEITESDIDSCHLTCDMRSQHLVWYSQTCTIWVFTKVSPFCR